MYATRAIRRARYDPLAASNLRILCLAVILVLAGWQLLSGRDVHSLSEGTSAGDSSDSTDHAAGTGEGSAPRVAPLTVDSQLWSFRAPFLHSYAPRDEVTPAMQKLVRKMIKEEVASLAKRIGSDEEKISTIEQQLLGSRDLAPGALIPMDHAAAKRAGDGGRKRNIHTIVTADSNPYMRWQMRQCHYWWKKVSEEPGSEFGGFTRILHTGEPDDLMDEIPTVVVEKGPRPDPGAPPIQRPNAVIRWMEQAWPKEEYVLMLEPDHVLVRSVPLTGVSLGRPLGFMFSYVNFEEHEKTLRPHLDAAKCAVKQAPRTGNSPALMHRDDLKKVSPSWAKISVALHGDMEVRKAVGWVGEMYGFSLAICEVGLSMTLQEAEFMIHPPFDTVINQTKIIHFTYGIELFANGTFAVPTLPQELRVWGWDKRNFTAPRRIPDPPANAFESARVLISKLNEAIQATFTDEEKRKQTEEDTKPKALMA